MIIIRTNCSTISKTAFNYFTKKRDGFITGQNYCCIDFVKQRICEYF